jgi:phosphoglycolate phosphatase
MTQRTFVFAGVAELIEQLLQRRLAWGVVTNKSKRFTDPLTRAMPLFASARAIVSGDSTPHSKPHPEPLLEAARQLGLAPQSCLYVGDDERDVVAGRAASMGTVAATYGYLGQKTDVSSWGAHALINSPAELLQLLDKA